MEKVKEILELQFDDEKSSKSYISKEYVKEFKKQKYSIIYKFRMCWWQKYELANSWNLNVPLASHVNVRGESIY